MPRGADRGGRRRPYGPVPPVRGDHGGRRPRVGRRGRRAAAGGPQQCRQPADAGLHPAGPDAARGRPATAPRAAGKSGGGVHRRDRARPASASGGLSHRRSGGPRPDRTRRPRVHGGGHRARDGPASGNVPGIGRPTLGRHGERVGHRPGRQWTCGRRPRGRPPTGRIGGRRASRRRAARSERRGRRSVVPPLPDLDAGRVSSPRGGHLTRGRGGRCRRRHRRDDHARPQRDGAVRPDRHRGRPVAGGGVADRGLLRVERLLAPCPGQRDCSGSGRPIHGPDDGHLCRLPGRWSPGPCADLGRVRRGNAEGQGGRPDRCRPRRLRAAPAERSGPPAPLAGQSRPVVRMAAGRGGDRRRDGRSPRRRGAGPGAVPHRPRTGGAAVLRGSIAARQLGTAARHGS